MSSIGRKRSAEQNMFPRRQSEAVDLTNMQRGELRVNQQVQNFLNSGAKVSDGHKVRPIQEPRTGSKTTHVFQNATKKVSLQAQAIRNETRKHPGKPYSHSNE